MPESHDEKHEHAMMAGNVGGMGGSSPAERDDEKAAEQIARSGETPEDLARTEPDTRDADVGQTLGADDEATGPDQA